MTRTSAIYRSPLPAPPVRPAVATDAIRHAAHDPAAPMVVDGATGETLSRGEVAARSAALAAGLRARGVGRGDLVTLAMPNCAWWPVVALGVWRAGAAVAPLSPLWTAEESSRVLAGAAPRMAVAAAPLVSRIAGAVEAAGIDAEIVAAGGDADGATPIAVLLESDEADPYADPELAPTDLAAVPFSSGTGGLPKGVRLTHSNLAAGAAHGSASVGIARPIDATAVLLGGAPYFHAIGLSLMLCAALRAGATMVTVPRPKLDAILPLIAAHRVTHMAVPPLVFEALGDDPLVDDHDLSSLRTVVTGGAHIAADVERRVTERLHCVARQGYGMTEATCTISAPLVRASTPGTVGWLVPGSEARLVDPETGADAAPGEPGELWVRGPHVMEGYHGLADATAATITSDGWLRTGDLVAVRDDGQFEVRDRLKELIKVNGASVAPAEVELVLRGHTAVGDAGVVGVPDAERGEIPIAFVVLTAPVEAEELHAFVGERLAAYKRPRDIVVVDELPRLVTGKLMRRTLRDWAAAAAPA